MKERLPKSYKGKIVRVSQSYVTRKKNICLSFERLRTVSVLVREGVEVMERWWKTEEGFQGYL